MRPATTLALCFMAAAAGGVTARLLPSEAPIAPVAGTSGAAKVALQAAELAADAALPAGAMAATPGATAAPGAPMPSLAPMLQNVTPAVVNIYTKQVVRVNNPIAEFFGGGRIPQERISQSLGSGVIVDATRGLILTNNHVVEGADAVSVTLGDGRTFEAQPIGSDADTDVAVIKINAPNLHALPLADSQALRVGDYVVAVGNPFGLGQTVTSGIVSAVGRSGLTGLGYQNFIQTDASINPGNSGGALVNLRGELVGINSASYNPRGSNAGNIGLGFAIPANLAREVMRQLMAYGEVRRGSLGVELRDVTADLAKQFGLGTAKGALVGRVYNNTPAAAAGLKPGDLIVSANNQRIGSAQELHNLEGLLPVGQAFRMGVVRDGQPLVVTATLKAQPKDIDGATLDARLSGAKFTDLPERYRQQGLRGVVVTTVANGSRAAQNGLAPGDLVLGINRRGVEDLNDFRARLASRQAVLNFVVQRGGARGELPMQ
jgi:Do/DeqQ family serine protease